MENVNLYRIYTEDVHPEYTREIVGRYFDGFTLLRGEGVWKGGREDALVIEIIGGVSEPDDERNRIELLCEALKEENVQESVLLSVCPVTNYLM